jgi:MFS family permease
MIYIHFESSLIFVDFGDGYIDPQTQLAAIKPALLGIIGASYSLGGILAVPFAPSANQWFGRRWSIITGSLTMMCGGVLQGCAQDGRCSYPFLLELVD